MAPPVGSHFTTTAQCCMTSEVPTCSRGRPGTRTRDDSAAMLMASFQITLDRYAICQANPHLCSRAETEGRVRYPVPEVLSRAV